MAAASYESALHLARSLSEQEQLRLIHELMMQPSDPTAKLAETSILDICGLGSDLWQQVDAQEYVRNERSTWVG